MLTNELVFLPQFVPTGWFHDFFVLFWLPPWLVLFFADRYSDRQLYAFPIKCFLATSDVDCGMPAIFKYSLTFFIFKDSLTFSTGNIFVIRHWKLYALDRTFEVPSHQLKKIPYHVAWYSMILRIFPSNKRLSSRHWWTWHACRFVFYNCKHIITNLYSPKKY